MGAFDNVEDPRGDSPRCDCSIRDYSDSDLKDELVRREKYRAEIRNILMQVRTEDLELEIKRRVGKNV
jgi:hypothetical protein